MDREEQPDPAVKFLIIAALGFLAAYMIFA